MRLVREKLIPLRLLTPAGPGMHEWSRIYRNLIFEMAFFIDRQGGEVTPQLVRKFLARAPQSNIVTRFSEAEVGLLMKKSVEYDLPVRSTPFATSDPI